MDVGDAFRDCLVDLDLKGLRQLWHIVAPHLPQPKTDQETLVSAHHARTQAKTIPFKLRAYSHRWLTERNLPSGLPDYMKPRAERLYPKIVTAVGIAVKSMSGANAPLAKALEQAMSDAVAEMYADGIEDPKIVKPHMLAAYNRTLKQA